ncbi:speckle targeted PIP5K1A-regulated poly(A) polymerase-like isoform X2 [Uloborus diversus]|uniref:speckle targeted PIP5K1A-regulated poly(A) polymerase-like isoform X2 n=1 Tax=Uloborus diversus TaxID=327109 RepID=UPI00240974EC|nr:speckle targeted PIP5K1A-regulated poly(A) polymerase-like isoform X2 [Uloborus diversus]
MSLKRGILHATEKLQKLTSVNQRNTICFFRAHVLEKNVKLFVPTAQTISHVGSTQNASLFSGTSRLYSAANEEAEKKQQYNVIDVQPIQFGDMKFDEPVSHDELLTYLQQSKSVEEQMKILVNTLALSEEDKERRICFAKKIESLLKPFFSEIKIQLFGSTMNGFGFKGCDIDMSFETPIKVKEVPYLERPDVPLVGEVLCGKVTPYDLSELPAKEQLLFIHQVFQEYYHESADPSIFINAHVSLVRFYHDKFNLKCDLSSRNKVAYANTKLLYLFGKLDERVIPLMMTFRYWAKHVELIGKGLMFNTYTISLLVIYFLQSRKPPILPSAELILSLSGELFKEFLLFYLYFDFTRVVCPLIARAVPREEFFKERNKKFRMNAICVQDPMDTSHNVAELVDYKHCRKLLSELVLSYKILEQSEKIFVSPKKYGLAAILDRPSIANIYKSTNERILSMNLPHSSKTVEKDSCSSELKALHTAESLMEILREALLFKCQKMDTDAIIDVLKKDDERIAKQKKIAQSLSECKVDLPHRKIKKGPKQDSDASLPLDNFPEESNIEQFTKFNSHHKLIFCIHCKASNNVWLGRDLTEMDLHASIVGDNALEREKIISLNTAKNNELYAEAKMKPFEFLCECYISNENPEASLVVNFRPLRKVFFNPVLGIFLKEYVPKLVTKVNVC